MVFFYFFLDTTLILTPPVVPDHYLGDNRLFRAAFPGKAEGSDHSRV